MPRHDSAPASAGFQGLFSLCYDLPTGKAATRCVAARLSRGGSLAAATGTETCPSKHCEPKPGAIRPRPRKRARSSRMSSRCSCRGTSFYCARGNRTLRSMGIGALGLRPRHCGGGITRRPSCSCSRIARQVQWKAVAPGTLRPRDAVRFSMVRGRRMLFAPRWRTSACRFGKAKRAADFARAHDPRGHGAKSPFAHPYQKSHRHFTSAKLRGSHM
jgi:hypothetical protein